MIRRLFFYSLLILVPLALSFGQDKIKDLESALKQNPNDIATLIALGKVYHEQASAGNEDAVEKGFDCFDRVIKLDPSNALAYAYRGSLWTMRGRDAWWPFTKAGDVDKGVDDMDKAVDVAPDDVSVRLLRGITSVHLPSMFRRLPTALKDFEFLLNDARFTHFDPRLRCTIYYWAGIAYKNDSQPARAKELLQKAASSDPGSDTSKRAESELKQMS